MGSSPEAPQQYSHLGIGMQEFQLLCRSKGIPRDAKSTLE
jgi:hypothetical protein